MRALIDLPRGALVASALVVAFTVSACSPSGDVDNLPAPTADAASVPLTPRFSDDPQADGWESEHFSELVSKRLKQIGAAISGGDAVEAWIASDFVGGALRPDTLARAFESAPFVVERGAADDGASAQGPTGFAAQLSALREAFDTSSPIRAEFKLFDIQLGDDAVTTRAYVALTGTSADGPREEHVTWRATWSRAEPLQLRSLHLEDFERTTLAARDEPLFADCTESLVGRRLADDELLGHGLPHWYVRIPASLGQSPLGYHGLAVGDANGDGLDDVYVCQPGGIPNQLFVQNADGTVTESAASSGVDWMETTTSALFIDIDNDGDQDLVGATTPLMVLENDGIGRFEGRMLLPGPGIPTSLAAADYDSDGDLDVFVCYSSNESPIPYHDAENGSPNVLWRNDGDFAFEDVTTEVGLDENGTRFSFAAAWEDHDNDGDLDLYVANDYGRNNFYRNTDGRFEDIAPQAGVEDISAGMGVTFGDYDHDGWMDLYVSNMFSSAGNRIAYQRDFNPTASQSERSVFQRHARGNSLFRGSADGFEDISVESGVTMGRWAWCSLFVDINNDTYQDLLVANGNVTNEFPDDL